VKVILFGATGMVGQGVLRECLLDADVESVLAVGRAKTGVTHDKLRELVGGIPKLGVEPSVSAEITSKLYANNVITCGLVHELRLIKTPDEIDSIRYAAQYADKGMERLVKSLYDGVSVIELFSLSRGLQMEVIKTGDYDPLDSEFLTVGWPAPLSAQPHSVPGLGDRLGKGPLSMMCTLRINGYSAECERTVFMGTVSERDRELFEHMKKARDIAFSMVRPGTPCADIDTATRDYFASQGLSDYILHRTGHGFGLSNHEAPWLSAGSKEILEKNMVISIEPALYLPEKGGFRHSDTVLVTEDGYECLTHYPTALEALTVPPSSLLKSLKGRVIRSAAGVG
jgi:Xaa-Pro aminopeptidase